LYSLSVSVSFLVILSLTVSGTLISHKLMNDINENRDSNIFSFFFIKRIVILTLLSRCIDYNYYKMNDMSRIISISLRGVHNNVLKVVKSIEFTFLKVEQLVKE